MQDRQDFWDIVCLIGMWQGRSVVDATKRASDILDIRDERINAELDNYEEESNA